MAKGDRPERLREHLFLPVEQVDGDHLSRLRPLSTLMSPRPTGRNTFDLCNTTFVHSLLSVDGSFCTRVTNNVERRSAEHQEGVAKGGYTSTKRPVELVLAERYHDIHQGIGREKQIKGRSRAKKEALISGDMKLLRFEALAYERRMYAPLTKYQRKVQVGLSMVRHGSTPCQARGRLNLP